jgi:hypothetical protein
MLTCPLTGARLEPCSLAEAESSLAATFVPRRRWSPLDATPEPIGRTPLVLLRADGACAYPTVDDVPVLLGPEALVRPGERGIVNLRHPHYAEAYEEMGFYNEVAVREATHVEATGEYALVRSALSAGPTEKASFPQPRSVWLDEVYDCASQWDAYSHLAPVEGARVLQIGGRGVHVVKFLLAGASEGWLLTPMVGEARFARTLAEACGVAERLRCVAGVAEELPFARESFDRVYSGGCVHHMVTEVAFRQIARVLRPSGRFAAIDPWRAPLYGLGTRLFGKREPVHCRPLTAARVAPAARAFARSQIRQHGTLTRYLLLALQKAGVQTSLSAVWTITRTDDAICSLIPGLRRYGSSVAVLAEA